MICNLQVRLGRPLGRLVLEVCKVKEQPKVEIETQQYREDIPAVECDTVTVTSPVAENPVT